MNEIGNVLLLMLTAILAENFIFAKFYGICPFLGVSKKTDTALGMGLQHIVVDNENTAKACINHLKNNKAGRATF